MKKLAKNTAIILCMAFMATAIQMCFSGCRKNENQESYCTDPEAVNYYDNSPCEYLSDIDKLTRIKWKITSVTTEMYQSGELITSSDSSVTDWTIQFFESGNFFEKSNGQTYQGQWTLTNNQLTLDQWTYDVDFIKMKTLKYRFKESWILNSTLYSRHTVFSATSEDA